MLVRILPAAAVHRALVQRRKADAVDFAGGGEADHVFERVAAETAGFVGTLAARIFRRIDIGQVNQRNRVAVEFNGIDVIEGFKGEPDTGITTAALEHAGVADHHHACH